MGEALRSIIGWLREDNKETRSELEIEREKAAEEKLEARRQDLVWLLTKTNLELGEAIKHADRCGSLHLGWWHLHEASVETIKGHMEQIKIQVDLKPYKHIVSLPKPETRKKLEKYGFHELPITSPRIKSGARPQRVPGPRR